MTGQSSRFSASSLLYFGALIMLGALCCAIASAVFHHTRPSTITVLIALAGVPYAVVLFADPPWSERYSLACALMVAALLAVPLLLAAPVLSDDVYRFVWEGKLWRHGFNPYLYAPAHPDLGALRDANWTQINNPALATIYPPLAQLVFLLGDVLGAGVWSFKLIALVLHLGCVVVVMHAARDPRAAMAIGCNPLALVEGPLNGHLDLAVGLCALACALSLARRETFRAAVFCAATAALKLVGVVLLPMFVPWKRALLVAAALIALAVLPLLVFQPADAGGAGLAHYSFRWQGNASLYALLESGVEQLLQGQAGPDQTVPVPAAWQRALPTKWQPRAVLSGESPREGLPLAIATPIVARALALLLVLALACFVSRRRAFEPLAAARLILLAVLLLSPQVNPWYLLWLLPLEAVLAKRALFFWSTLVLLAYIPLDRWQLEQVWIEPTTARAAQYALLTAILIAEHIIRRPQGGTQLPNSITILRGASSE